MAGALAEAGATTAILDIDSAACNRLAEYLKAEYGTCSLPIPVDLNNTDQLVQVPGQVVRELGSLDILVNTAALVGTSQLDGWSTSFENQNIDTWRKALEVNLTAAFAITQAAVPHLRTSGHGSIVNIGSIYGLVGPDWQLYEGTSLGNPAAYAASKGGLLQLTRWLATTLAPKIRVNSITPGGIFRNQTDPFHKRYLERTPLLRMGTEEDFKGAVVYLASDLSAYVTGHNLVVDGGWTAW